MAIVKRKLGTKQYYYFMTGTNAKTQLFLGREGNPNTANIRKAQKLLDQKKKKLDEQKQTLTQLLKATKTPTN